MDHRFFGVVVVVAAAAVLCVAGCQQSGESIGETQEVDCSAVCTAAGDGSDCLATCEGAKAAAPVTCDETACTDVCAGENCPADCPLHDVQGGARTVEEVQAKDAQTTCPAATDAHASCPAAVNGTCPAAASGASETR